MRKTTRSLIQEIQEELETLDAEYKRLEARLETVEERRDELRDLASALRKIILESDPAEQSALPFDDSTKHSRKGTPLGVFLRETLADGTPKTVDEIAAIAQKTIPGETKGKSVRRMVNFALYALYRHGAVSKDNEGRWQIKSRQ